MADLSLMKWSFQALVVNEFQGTSLTCTEKDKKCFEVGACMRCIDVAELAKGRGRPIY